MSKNATKIVSSKALHDELNEERRKTGLHEIPAINSLKGSTGTLARKDKSFRNALDFFRQMFNKDK